LTKKNPTIKGNRQLRYVDAYSRIEAMIKQGDIKPGDKLPGENELCVQLGISRGTLRQALLLLREDGMIYNHQGKGNYVTVRRQDTEKGVEQIGSLAHCFNTVEYDEISLEVQYTPSSAKMQEFLDLNSSTLTMNFHISYKVKENVAAMAIYFIPFESITPYHLDLSDNEALLAFIQNYVKEKIASSKSMFNLTTARESVAKRMNLPEGTPLLYFSEEMMLPTGEKAVYVKSYFEPSYFNFMVYRH